MKKAQLVSLENNQALTTSRIVADKFDKQHKNVVRDIDKLVEQMALESQSSKVSPVQMFVKTTYQAEEGGRKYPMYLMNKDGFMLLTMGFTGKKALQFKLKFIDAFNRMEEKLKARAISDRDARWAETRQLGKQTRKLLTQAIKALEEYFLARGNISPRGYLYGHLTNLIQNALGIEKGGRDNCSVKKLNQLDQAEDMAGGVILRSLADNNISSLAQIDAQILLQLRKLNDLLSGQLFLPY